MSEGILGPIPPPRRTERDDYTLIKPEMLLFSMSKEAAKLHGGVKYD
jgi:hypothetical protein